VLVAGGVLATGGVITAAGVPGTAGVMTAGSVSASASALAAAGAVTWVCVRLVASGSGGIDVSAKAPPELIGELDVPSTKESFWVAATLGT
jgi:hypothetical protein